MEFKSSPLLALIAACALVSGCSGQDLDFCTLLSLDEVAEFDSTVQSSEMGVRGETAPTNYCIYKNAENDEVFLLSIGNPTKNQPYDILRTFSQYMEGKNSVESVSGVGDSAAALFSDDYEKDKFRLLIANGNGWSVTVRAKGVESKNSQRFGVVKSLADRALARF